MKRVLLTSIFILVIFASLISCSQEKNIEKANELIITGAYDQAVSLLDKEIQDDPKNKKAHLAMANCLATKYANDLIKGIKKNQALKRKAISYYESALQIDPNYIAALFNLSDFYFFIGQKNEAKAGFEKVFKLDDNNSGVYMPLLRLSRDKIIKEKLKQYYSSVLKNETFEMIPQQNKGTVIISCDDCEALLREKEGNDSQVKLKQYAVYKKAKINGDNMEFYYDTIEKLNDREECFYTLALLKMVVYNTGPKHKPYMQKELNSKLYKRTLTEKEKKILWETPWLNGAGTNCTSCNIKMLFTGDYYYSVYSLNKYPEYKLSNEIPYVDKNNYREIEPVGKSITYKIKYLGAGYLSNKYSKIVAQKVKARKYIRSVDRYAQTSKENTIWGSGDINNDRRLAKAIKKDSLLSEDQKIVLLGGRVYKGTPKNLIEFLSHGNLQLIRKYYVKNTCYEQWEDRRTQKVFDFRNNLLENVYTDK